MRYIGELLVIVGDLFSLELSADSPEASYLPADTDHRHASAWWFNQQKKHNHRPPRTNRTLPLRVPLLRFQAAFPLMKLTYHA